MSKKWKDVWSGQAKKFKGAVPKYISATDVDNRAISSDIVEGRTPLHWAAEWGLADCITLCINNGAQVDKQDIRGNTVDVAMTN